MTDTMTAAETRKARGLKRTCQDEACGSRFYDLGRQEIACPVCGAAFHPPAEVVATTGYKRRRPAWGAMTAAAVPAAAEAVIDPIALDKSEDEPVAEPELDSSAEVVLEDIEDEEPPVLDDVAIED